MAGRSEAKANGAVARLLAEEAGGDGAGTATGTATGVVLDLSSFASVRALASKLPPRLDVLVNNAGIWASNDLTEDRIGETAQVSGGRMQEWWADNGGSSRPRGELCTRR